MCLFFLYLFLRNLLVVSYKKKPRLTLAVNIKCNGPCNLNTPVVGVALGDTRNSDFFRLQRNIFPSIPDFCSVACISGASWSWCGCQWLLHACSHPA